MGVYSITLKISVISPQNIYKSDILPPKYKYITKTCSVSRFEQVFYICNIFYFIERASLFGSLAYIILYIIIYNIYGGILPVSRAALLV